MNNLLSELNSAARQYRADSRLSNRYVAESKLELSVAREKALAAGWSPAVVDRAQELGGDQIQTFLDWLSEPNTGLEGPFFLEDI